MATTVADYFKGFMEAEAANLCARGYSSTGTHNGNGIATRKLKTRVFSTLNLQPEKPDNK